MLLEKSVSPEQPGQQPCMNYADFKRIANLTGNSKTRYIELDKYVHVSVTQINNFRPSSLIILLFLFGDLVFYWLLIRIEGSSVRLRLQNYCKVLKSKRSPL